MPRPLPNDEPVPHAPDKLRFAPATPRQRREVMKGIALARQLKTAADRHDAGEAGEDVTDMSSDDFIARLRR